MAIKSKNLEFNKTRNLIILCLASYVVVTGFGVIIPFFPIYANDFLNSILIGPLTIGIAFQIGILTSSFMFTRFLLAPSFGDLSDSSGRKPIILVGMSIYGFLMIGFGLAYDFPTLLIIRLLQGVASAAVWPVGEALIVDTAPEDEVGKYLGYYMMSMQAGMATGPFIGFGSFFLLNTIAALPVELSYRLSFISVGILGFLSVVIIAFFVTDPITLKLTSEEKKLKALYTQTVKIMLRKMIESPKFWYNIISKKASYRNRSIYSIYVIAIINGIGLAMVFPIISLFLEDYYQIDPGGIALIIGIVGTLGLVGGPLGGYFSDIFSRKKVVWITQFIGSIFLFFLGFEMAISFLILFLIGQRFIFAIIQPSFRALQSDLIPPSVRGKEFGLVQASANLGSVLGPLFGGLIYDVFFFDNFVLFGHNYFGAGIAFALASIAAIIGGLLLIFLINVERDNYKEVRGNNTI